MTGKICFYHSPLGDLGLAASDGALTGVYFPGQALPPGLEKGETPLLKRAAAQLAGYFQGKRRVFDLPLRPAGTAFQMAVWAALQKIPYGETRSYRDIATMIGRPLAVRAVGQANHRNPISIIIPCHRVIGADGSLTGYGGGLETKRFLLELERRGR